MLTATGTRPSFAYALDTATGSSPRSSARSKLACPLPPWHSKASRIRQARLAKLSSRS